MTEHRHIVRYWLVLCKGNLVSIPEIPEPPENGLSKASRLTRQPWTAAQLADFIQRHKPQIRDIARRRLSSLARREGDSEDVASSVFLRMLELANEGKITAQSDSELFSYISVVTAHNAINKHRLIRRAEQMLPEDGEYVRGLLERLEHCEDDTGATMLVSRMVTRITDETDRQVLLLRLRGAGHRAVANLLRTSVSAAQKRWTAIRDQLAAAMRRGDFDE